MKRGFNIYIILALLLVILLSLINLSSQSGLREGFTEKGTCTLKNGDINNAYNTNLKCTKAGGKWTEDKKKK